jgi:DNA (cytosine-5)-methyltransferase 1
VTGLEENGGRTPNIRRNTRMARELEDAPFNVGRVEWVDSRSVKTEGRTYRMADLFAGCGGLSLGFEMANFMSEFAVEVDRGAALTYRHNFPHTTVINSRVENVSTKTVHALTSGRPLDVLCAGFPCPGFSIAGRKNADDPRNILYKQVVRIASLTRPGFVVMENVPRFVNVGTYLSDVLEAFERMEYSMSAHILESAKYGVPQFRPRTILIGNRLGLKNPYPKPLLDESSYVPIEKAIGDLKGVPWNPLINHEWTKHTSAMEDRIKKVPPGGSLYPSFLDAWKRQYVGVPSMTIKENHGGNHIHYELNRVLSAREMARLQSFPDSFVFWGTLKRALFQIGNAVPPLLGKHVALAVRTALDRVAVEVPQEARAI